MNSDLWYENLKNQAEKYIPPVAPTEWENIERKLSGSRPLYRIKIWISAAAAVILICLALTLIIKEKLNIEHLEPVFVHSHSTSISETPGATRLQPFKPLRLSYIKRAIVSEPIEPEYGKIMHTASLRTAINPLSDYFPKLPVRRSYQYTKYEKKSIPANMGKHQKKSHEWSTGLKFKNVFSSTSNEYSKEFSALMYSINSNGRNSEGSKYINETYEFKHQIPFSAGIIFNYGIHKKWEIESGIEYTLMKSNGYLFSESGEFDVKQELHYLGIPLKLNYKFYDRKHTDFYISAGGSIEKCLSARQKIYMPEDVTNRRKTISRPQFSVSSSVGMKLKLSPKWGLYLSPGVVYYFDNNSPVETVRKQHPFNFKLDMGLYFRIK